MKTAGYDTRLENEDSVAHHIALKPEVVAQRLADGIPLLPPHWAWAWDENGHDGWLDWEGPRQSDDEGHHIVILTLHPMEMMNALYDLHDMLQPSDSGYHVIISDPHEWYIGSEGYTFVDGIRPFSNDEIEEEDW